jgi:hypothetical protein
MHVGTADSTSERRAKESSISEVRAQSSPCVPRNQGPGVGVKGNGRGGGEQTAVAPVREAEARVSRAGEAASVLSPGLLGFLSMGAVVRLVEAKPG